MRSRVAVDDLIQRRGKLLSFLERRVGQREDAEEILQAAFLKMVEAAPGDADAADPVRNVEAWFYRILRNAVVDYYRRKDASRRGRERLAAEAEVAFLPELEPEACRCVLDALSQLRAPYREIVDRVDVQGDAVVAAATRLGISPGNARIRLHRARGELREALVQLCGACSEHGCLDCSCQPPAGSPNQSAGSSSRNASQPSASALLSRP